MVFINTIVIYVVFVPNISANAKWAESGITVAGGNGMGDAVNQFHDPYGLFVDEDQTIYIADRDNHRVMEWKAGATSGQLVAGGNGRGSAVNQLNQPSDVIFDKKTDSLFICDFGNRRVMQWPRGSKTGGKVVVANVVCWGLTMDDNGLLYVIDTGDQTVKRYIPGQNNEIVVAGGNGEGDACNQLNLPINIFVDQDYSVYVSDWKNHRVMKWMKDAKEGIVVAGGRGSGNSLEQLSHPRGLLVDQLGTVYVADTSNHRVMRCRRGTTKGDVIIGGIGAGKNANQINYPTGFAVDRAGNLYVADHNNYRVQRFLIET